MYKCHECNKDIGPRIPCNKVVLQTRKKTYKMRPKIYPGKTSKRSDRRDDPGGEGWEIVQEVFICPNCLKTT